MRLLRFAATTCFSIFASAAHAETYRLVHAMGNAERIHAKRLSKTECEKRKAELEIVATTLGTYDEKRGIGSITCLPDSLFAD